MLASLCLAPSTHVSRAFPWVVLLSPRVPSVSTIDRAYSAETRLASLELAPEMSSSMITIPIANASVLSDT